ncbi:MAG: Uma2 family endonuclease [Acidobacteriota bacterium]|nr:Uma2 family endonuclease [Acidobacteriota bacterium]
MQQTILETISEAASFIGENSKTDSQKSGVKLHKWTQKEYCQMAELGFFHGKRVELIEGEIIEISPMKTAHATALGLITQILTRIFSENFIVRAQMPMSFAKANEPEPDAAVVKGTFRDFMISHPKTAEIIVEVSDSTLRYDQTVKVSLYAQNKIREYWILNLKNAVWKFIVNPKKITNSVLSIKKFKF